MFKQLLKSLVRPRHSAQQGVAGGRALEQLVEQGALAQRAGQRGLARQLYLQAFAIDAKNPDVLHLLGVLSHQERNHDDAIELIGEAIALRPGVADFHMNIAVAYLARGQTGESIANSREALRLRPVYPKAHANLLFALIFSNTTPAEILEEHQRWYRSDLLPALQPSPPAQNPREPGRRLRVAYVSADFREHVVARFVEPLFAHHDKRQFVVFAYDEGNASEVVNQRLSAYTDHWRPIHGRSDDEVADLIRGDGIDILIDLSGHSLGGRLGVFARGPAPVQAAYLGYPATSGVPAIGFRITDSVCDPPGLTESHYVERLARLPHCLCCYQPPLEIAPMPALPALPALENGHITFGSFNQPAKLQPEVLELWGRVLHAVPESHLLMAPTPHGFTRQRYLQIFAAQGIAAARIEFEARMPLPEYQSLRGRVDIALDSFPMNGGSTTCETLYMGVPIVTLLGQRFASRTGASMLTAMGLQEYIAHSPDQYLAIAVALAADLPRLAALRDGMRARMLASSLMDGARCTRSLEALYRGLWADWCVSRPAVPVS
jgi:protein O-GlcNAc transferase